MKVYAHGFGFLRPLCEGAAEFVEDPAEAEIVLTMNNPGGTSHVIDEARHIATQWGIPLCWWTCEDPNGYGAWVPQAKAADFVFTSDKAMLPHYRRDVGHGNVFWLPLAANPEMHHPLPLAEDATDFVFSGNWYDNQWEARRWGSEVLIRPLVAAGYSMTIYSYDSPASVGYTELEASWRGGTSCYTTCEQYAHGRIVLGNNNQRTGLDGRPVTYMTSMRTFEVLACGKAFMAPQSDAYEALGFVCGEHMEWVDTPEAALLMAEWLLARPLEVEAMGRRGRAFVLAHHTYAHRLQRIARALDGQADPEDWR